MRYLAVLPLALLALVSVFLGQHPKPGSGGGSGGNVDSVFSRTGVVTAQSGDYTATQVTNTPAGNIAATTVQAAIDEIDTEKQSALGFTPEDSANKNQPSGYAGLDGSSLLSHAQLPTVLPTKGGTGLTSGTSGGILCFTASTTIASSGALTSNLPVLGGGAGVCPSVGTRSGNTTEFGTISGTKTISKQLAFDADGNIIASASDIGSGSGVNGAPNSSVSFSSVTSVVITHNLGTKNIIVECRDASDNLLLHNGYSSVTTNALTVNFTGTVSGFCIYNATQGSGVAVDTENASFNFDDAYNMVLCDANSATVVGSLPAAATAGAGREYTMVKTDASGNSCTFDADGSETISGSGTLTNTVQWDSYTIRSTGSGWVII